MRLRQLAVCLFVLLWLDKNTLISCLSDDHDDRNEKHEEITNDESSDADDDSLYVRSPSYVEPIVADVHTLKDEAGSIDASETEFESAKIQTSQGSTFNITFLKDGPGSKHGSDEKAEFERLFGVSAKKRVSGFLKKHSIQITVALVLVAFRREISSLLGKVAYDSVKDPNTGRATKRLRVFDLKPTSILKMLVFVYIVRRLQRFGDASSILSPTTLLLLTRLLGNPWLSLLLSGFMPPSNPAYIPPIMQHYTFERLNDRYSKDQQAYSKIVEDTTRGVLKRMTKGHGTSEKNSITDIVPGLQFLRQESEPSYNDTIVVMDWTKLDASVSRLDVLRDEVSFLIDCHQERDEAKDGNDGKENNFEVVVLLESPGGSVSEYALAAQQLIRLRDEGINVTVCVDKIAASGGYMIACTSSPGRLFAAPFALVGSIGVVGQTINVHKVLQGWGVTPMVFRGGRDKAPLGWIGEVTKEGMEKVQLMVDDVHKAFKRHVANSRPSIASRIEEIATGDSWLGYDALELGLIDKVLTSDEYIGERIRNGSRVLKLYRIVHGRGLFSRRTATLTSTLDSGPKPNFSAFLSAFPSLSEFNAFLRRLQGAIAGLLADDYSSLTRSVGVRAPKPCSSM
jgi:signal peptide peptidase SppA